MATNNIGLEMTTESNNQVYKKVAWRLVPFLCLCYLAAYLDRVNVLLPGYVVTDLNSDFLKSEAGEKLRSRIPTRRFGDITDLDGHLLSSL
jgi:hypothetical protein